MAPSESDTEGMVLVMGVTGAGKSTFVNTLKAESVQVGHGLESTRSPPQAVKLFLDEEQKYSVTVVDTPGFDDTWRSDGEVLAEITKFLAAQYALKIPLLGIIYLHQIHETRMKGSSRRFLEHFEKLCGDSAFSNVILVTTRWDQIKPAQRGDALRRERELIDNWWAPMQQKGAQVTQFHGSRVEAEAILLDLVRDRSEIVLDVQRELVDQGKEVGETRVGLDISGTLAADAAKWRWELARVDDKLAGAKRAEDEMKALKEEKKQAEKILQQIEKSQKKLGIRVGVETKERVGQEQERASRTKGGLFPTAVTLFAGIVSVVLNVVDFVAF